MMRSVEQIGVTLYSGVALMHTHPSAWAPSYSMPGDYDQARKFTRLCI